MPEVPFNLKINVLFPDSGSSRNIVCKDILRIVERNREVYDAQLNGQPVIAKIFYKPIRGKYQIKKEWYGLNQMQKLGLNVPKPLFFGETENGKYVIVTEKIENATTALNIFKVSRDVSRVALIKNVCKELAKLHIKGVEQKDLHLGNFLFSENKVIALDTGEMRFHNKALPRNMSIAQLAFLTSYFPSYDIEGKKDICEKYFHERGWNFQKTDLDLILKLNKQYAKKGIEQALKKSVRTSTRTLKLTLNGSTAVLDRTFCSKEKAVEFFKQIDSLVDSGEILKRGNSCHVSAAIWADKKIVIKRYNHKSFFNSVYSSFTGSRARNGWLFGLRLRNLNVNTPKPVAFYEKRKFNIIWNSYIVTEFVDGQKLHNLLEQNINQEIKTGITRKIMEMLSILRSNSISHGDLKHSNILICGNEPLLTDLDSMKLHRCKWLGRYKASRDMKKFINGNRIGSYDIKKFLPQSAEINSCAGT